MSENSEIERIHKFERAGLGKAPFKVVGNYEAKWQACPGAPIQPGASCDNCGQGIMDVYAIRGADGKQFKVGCDCVMGAGDAGLRRQINKVKTAKRHEKEAVKITELRALLSDESVRAKLAALPHPDAGRREWASAKTLLDWAAWMFDHSGNAGKLKVLRAVKKASGL